jgi:hypothetical protein
MLYFIYYEVRLLQYSKIARSKLRTPTVDIFISSKLISQICIRSERVATISIVIYVFNVFKFRGTFSTFPNHIALYMLGVHRLHQNIMVCYSFLHFILKSLSEKTMQNSPESRLANPFKQFLVGKPPHNICKCISFFSYLIEYHDHRRRHHHFYNFHINMTRN